MRARLALAQALLPKPELLILDEPSDGLDPEGIAEMRQTVLRLHRELGLTILLSSHLLNEVEQLCTRIAVMDMGRKVFDGHQWQAIARQEAMALRINVKDFSAAAALLKGAGLITDDRDGHLVELKEGLGGDQLIRFMVEKGVAVYGIWLPNKKRWRDFYLGLIKAEDKRRQTAGDSRRHVFITNSRTSFGNCSAKSGHTSGS